MTRKRELLIEVEAAGRTFTFKDALLELTANDPEILDAYFATAKIEKEYEGDGEEEFYVVKSGDGSLSKIAKKKGTTVAAIIKSDPKITNANKHKIKVGQKITLSSKKLKGQKIIFTKASEADVGDEVYIIVKTSKFENRSLKINIMQGKEKGIVAKDGNLTVQQGGKDVAIVKSTTGDYSKTKYLNKDDFKDWAIAKIKLQPKEKNKLKLWNNQLKDLKDKKTKLYLLVDAHTDNSDLEIEYYGYKETGDAKDEGAYKNCWLDKDKKWFELKKKMPIIVIDPGHGYTSGSAGSSVRLYNHKIKGDDGKSKKDKKGKFIIEKSVKLDDLPQYVIDDVKSWVTGIKKGAYSNKYTERALTFDVAHALYNELIKVGISKGKLHIFRKNSDDRNENNGKTLGERIKYANKIKADYYISIHADGDDVKISQSGAHSIYASSSNTVLSKKLASDILKYYTVIPILPESPKKDIRNLAIFKPYHKTKRVTLIEMGYVTNPKEAKALFSNSKKIGIQIAKGLDEHINNEFK